ncbi:hypothetical protein [Acinetobacter sp. Ac_5812]|uniref:hypothetical protein n=1 Tax=Acinetobacter sp. Ac_5812 TaxID=1848937 RepID=UPI00148FEF65|nr:hypothetical protein [Acinetobacter sp. Ac_5812]NNP67969.1 hypothetical protein [Acinetobacter sp. Ac_5812]
MRNFGNNRHWSLLIFGIVSLAICSSIHAASGLQILSDKELSDTDAQSLFGFSYTSPTDAGNPNPNIGFYRLGMTADLELNANIKKFQLGCGGVNGANGCDIDIDHVRFTGMVNNSTVDGGPSSDFLFRNPFISFAIKNPDSPATRQVVGMQIGFDEAFGKFTAGEPDNYNSQDLSFTYNNDPDKHTGINSLSGDIGLSLINSQIPAMTCATGANASRTGCNLGIPGIPIGNISIDVDAPNMGDNRYNLALGRANTAYLQDVKARYPAELPIATIHVNWLENLKFVHEIIFGQDINGNGQYVEGAGAKDFVLISLSSLGDNVVNNNQFSNPNNLKWQRASNPSEWYSAPRGFSLSAPGVSLGNTTTNTVYIGAEELPAALLGAPVNVGNLDAGLRPVDNCYGNLTFC